MQMQILQTGASSDPRTPSSANRKIEQLFHDRLLALFCLHLGIERADKTILSRPLVRLQRSIYDLDSYGENSWSMDKTCLDVLWQDIVSSLGIFGIKKDRVSPFVADIRAYQEIELDMRSGILPSNVAIDHFYQLKTCDVRLSRQILGLYSRHHNLNTCLRLWNLFDLASEILDDLSDISEDLTTYNGNRFLISALTRDYESTKKEYLSFLHLIERQATLHGSSSLACTIQHRTEEAALALNRMDKELSAHVAKAPLAC
jgi:hypothetical protein